MSDQGIVNVIEFFRDDPNGRASCQIKVFGDGSASIKGRDVGGIFEECPDAVERAVKYVQSKGYVRCDHL